MHPLKDPDDAQRLLTQAAERLPQITQLAEAGEAAWFLEFAGSGQGFLVEWIAERTCLVLCADLGVPPPEGEIAALNLALSYNALWREIGDLRIARDGDDGELMLIGELGPEDCEPETFLAALQHFESLQRWWTQAIAKAGEPNDAAPVDHALLLGRI